MFFVVDEINFYKFKEISVSNDGFKSNEKYVAANQNGPSVKKHCFNAIVSTTEQIFSIFLVRQEEKDKSAISGTKNVLSVRLKIKKLSTIFFDKNVSLNITVNLKNLFFSIVIL